MATISTLPVAQLVAGVEFNHLQLAMKDYLLKHSQTTDPENVQTASCTYKGKTYMMLHHIIENWTEYIGIRGGPGLEQKSFEYAIADILAAREKCWRNRQGNV